MLVNAQLDYMEKRGSGLKKICNATKALETYKEGRDPVFKSSVSQFMTVIYSMEYEEGEHGELNGELNDSQKETLAFIKEHEGCQATMIAETMEIPFSTIDKHIRVLLKTGAIERRGSKKTGGYYVKK